MAIRSPRVEFAVGAFLLVALASLLVLAFVSTNRQFGDGGGQYPLHARFSSIGQLRLQAPVRIGGVTVGRVSALELDPKRFDALVTLDIDKRYQLPADTSAGIFTSGLLGEEIAYTQPAVDLIQLAGKYMFGGGSASTPATPNAPSNAPSPTEATP